MTTHLAATPILPGQLDLLNEVADTSSPLGTLHASDFRAACESVADDMGWVDPNKVSKYLHERFGEINARAYSAQWAGACGKNGFLVKLDRLVDIDPTHSRGNGGKRVHYRRLRSAIEVAS